MKHVIVVCGTYHEYLEFKGWFHYENEIAYHYMLANDYTRIMGFSKHTTSVIRIGTWYKNITEDAERYLSLFQGDV